MSEGKVAGLFTRMGDATTARFESEREPGHRAMDSPSP